MTSDIKLYSVLAHVRYAHQRHQLLEVTRYFLPDAKQMPSEVRNNCDLNAFWELHYKNTQLTNLSFTSCVRSTSSLSFISAWLCSFQPWYIVESITFYLLLRIDRHCKTVSPVNAWNTGNDVALSLLSAVQIGHTSFLPDTMAAAIPPPYLIPWLSMCVCRACHRRPQPALRRLYHDIVRVRLLLSSSSMCPAPRCAGSIWLLLVLPVADVMRLHYFQVRDISLVWQHSQMLGKYT